MAGHDRPEEEDQGDELSTSNVSTVNSIKQKNLMKMSDDNKYLFDQVKLYKADNAKLLNEVLEFQKNYQSLLKSQAQDQSMWTDVIKNFVTQISHCSSTKPPYERQCSLNSHGYFSDVSENRKSGSPTLENCDETDKSGKSVVRKNSNLSVQNPRTPRSAIKLSTDLKLNDWLLRTGLDDDSRICILNAEFSYEDFLYETDKEDIRRIGLR